MLKLVSRVSQYYSTSAITIPIFLESEFLNTAYYTLLIVMKVGGFSIISFRYTTINSDKSFFYDRLVSLINLSWQQLAAA